MAPRSRGLATVCSGMIGVAAAAAVRARPAISARTHGSMMSHAAVISPPMKMRDGFSAFTIIASPRPK